MNFEDAFFIMLFTWIMGGLLLALFITYPVTMLVFLVIAIVFFLCTWAFWKVANWWEEKRWNKIKPK